MGKREQNKARKRAEIVDIATRSFFERGYAATSMSAIAEELGGSKATLWAHFGSKEDLFAAVIDSQIDTFARDIDEVLTSQIYSVPTLHRFCLRFLDCLLRKNSIELYRLVLSDGERFPEIREMFYTRGPAKIRECVVGFYATHFDRDQAGKLMQLTVSAITGYRSDILVRPDKPTKADRETFVDNLVALIALSADAGTLNS
ncbi:TetR/AcrR family transcriptional regulator [Novosphingobium mangrovi (ex Huang et al. 2023)]|uniref:TetR/AcrR family transcriptional regulator n=1 Tax=Novosphingobium mangrovi (ex Huang et al. 2023) TaxID=2976432 RepID=A0ABT2I4S3_9SPHN|nr:TetR/AcrR family transcriptional regulator [Novosphingobium mangrovi (ex Huang et al. 2023)]MCT2399825.1 TetR/AcrR family transcriptional regulator [Novosphingobium mangrovi (ex Huang et al. 2023)]